MRAKLPVIAARTFAPAKVEAAPAGAGLRPHRSALRSGKAIASERPVVRASQQSKKAS